MDTTHQKILVLFAHPALQRSRVNRHLIDGLAALEGVTFHDLYEVYPDHYIDVKAEQALLAAHDIIIMHFPFYWYSTPAILKEWQDLVLTHGWAYGHDGQALKDKTMFIMVTTGAPEQAYTPQGFHRATLSQLMLPLERTAQLCNMNYLPPFVVAGTHLMEANIIQKHKHDYHRLLKALIQEQVDLDLAMKQQVLNHNLPLLLKEVDDVR